MSNPTHLLAAYKAQLQQSDIQTAYHYLMKYVLSLRSRFSQLAPKTVNVGNLSPGYMDYSYFPFFTTAMREQLLRFGIVLNHHELRFELWLMGQNAAIQERYWQRLKHSPWNAGLDSRPQYSVLEAIVLEHPNFDDPTQLSTDICQAVFPLCNDILDYLNLPHLSASAKS